MKASVGLLSDRTVLRSKMEGPRPDKFTLTRLNFCGNLSQQLNITYFYIRTEYIQGYDTPQYTYPLGSLVFGVLDLDAAPYLERGRTLLERYRGVNFPKDQTMQQSLASPDTCVYYQVASFYHDFAAAVRQVSPALFDLLESYTLVNFRRNERELKATQHSLLQFIQTEKNDSLYKFDELRARMSHFGELAHDQRHHGRILPELSGVYRSDEGLYPA